MKKTYKKPQFNIQCFAPNEFCIACGTVDLQCNVFMTDFTGRHFPHDLYLETNGVPGLQPGEDKLIMSEGESCQETFNVKVDSLQQGYATIKGREMYTQWPVWVFEDTSRATHYHAYASYDKPVGAERS